jgi:sugar transferase (PEP-CTERM/EpsH1 system associated)
LRIVVLTSRFPYPIEKGDKLRLYHQIRELSKINEIILCALSHSTVSEEAISEIEKFCSKVIVIKLSYWRLAISLWSSLIQKFPLQVAFFYEKHVHKLFLKIIEKERPDLIYFQLIRTAPYSTGVHFPKVIDFMDCFSEWTKKLSQVVSLPLNLVLKIEVRRVTDYESKVFEEFQGHIIISEQDKNNMPVLSKEKLLCVPNGVDTSYFLPQKNAERHYDLAFIGNLGYYNNIQAVKYVVKELLPELISWKPDFKLLIAGARPPRELLNLRSSNIVIEGWAEDIRSCYAASKVFIAPIHLAVGLQNKILEAMSMGIPCVTTSSVNKAIGAKPGEEILIADSKEEFVQLVKMLLMDEKLQAKLATGGLSLVKNNFTWSSSVERLQKLMESVSSSTNN